MLNYKQKEYLESKGFYWSSWETRYKKEYGNLEVSVCHVNDYVIKMSNSYTSEDEYLEFSQEVNEFAKIVKRLRELEAIIND